MSGRKQLICKILVACLVGVGLLFGLQLNRPAEPRKPQTWRPFTIIEKTVSHVPQDRVDPVVSETLFAVSNNGSMVWQLTSMEPRGTMITALLLDRDDGTFTNIHHSLKARSTTEIDELKVDLIVSRIPDCTRYKEGWERFTPSEMDVLGFPVEGFRETFKGGTTELLVAPALDCYPMREIYRSPRGAWNERYVISVQLKEPSAALFQVPPHYVERSPLEINELYKKSFGVEYYPGSKVSEVESLYQRTKRPRPH